MRAARQSDGGNTRRQTDKKEAYIQPINERNPQEKKPTTLTDFHIRNAASLSRRLSSSSISFACTNILPRLCIVGFSGCLDAGEEATGDESGSADLTFAVWLLATAVSTTSIIVVDLGRSTPNLLESVPVTDRRRLPIERAGRAVGGGFCDTQRAKKKNEISAASRYCQRN